MAAVGGALPAAPASPIEEWTWLTLEQLHTYPLNSFGSALAP
jgi:hypothetical protein